jgi:hypothetical protein
MDMQTLKLLIEALRTQPAPPSVTPLTGPDAGTPRPVGPASPSPMMLGGGMARNAAAAIQNNPARY